MDDIIKEFLVESSEGLDRLDRDLLALEEDSSNPATIASIFRTIHTIKGTSGFLAFKKLESLTHVAESLLSQLRDGLLAVNVEITSALLATTDAVRSMLGAIEKSGADGDSDYADLVAQLAALNLGKNAAAPTDVPTLAPVAPAPAPAVEAPSVAEDRQPAPAPAVEAPSVAEDRQPVLETAPRNQGCAAAAPAKGDAGDEARHDAATSGTRISDTSIRVDVELLDKLMNLVGELVLARNQILQFNNQIEDSQFLQTSQRLNLVTTELQEGVMKTRMQPIGNVWSKFPRVVRDLALACDKKVRIEMEGKETDLDRTLLEAIKDPLTHIVRNAVDHGIESPATRAAAGKPEEGVLRLRAFHEGGQVNLEISDDGGGIDVERVKAKAVSQNLITADHAARMSDREALSLIFRPGFSTAAKVTNISGRGVGMDVVKSNIEKIGGTVDLQSKLGEGTTLKIKIPLTLAIIPALIVTCGGDRYAIPQVSLLELVRLEGAGARQGIENLHGSLVHRLRGNLLPLVFLSDELAITKGRSPRDVLEAIRDEINIVVLQADGRPFGLVVDRIQDTEEIVVKPLGRHLKNLAVFAGTTIMGDGRVALILDVVGIAQRAALIGESTRERASLDARDEDRANAETRTLLLCRVGSNGRLAIPLSKVSRLEEFKSADVERAGEHRVVQYRGEIMPILDLAAFLPSGDPGVEDAGHEKDVIQVVVHGARGRNLGLAVGRILDIVHENIAVHHDATREGVLETVVIQGKVTEVVDLDWVMDRTDHLLHLPAHS
jgi:two-component system chemotaxis sensor kinase CheA